MNLPRAALVPRELSLRNVRRGFVLPWCPSPSAPNTVLSQDGFVASTPREAMLNGKHPRCRGWRKVCAIKR